VIERVARGEKLVITKDGRPVAELWPIAGPGLKGSVLSERWSRLPPVDPDRVRRDIDETIGPAL
jgi:antitoxin (DNA-binding transcriptional repressor) of toxin-antitoxin stability system